MSEQIPAGWYPDPKDITSDPRPQRWWDGTGWTASTRPTPSDAPPSEPPTPEPAAAQAPGPDATAETRVLEGEVLGSGPTVRYPEPPPFGTAYGTPAPSSPKRRRKPSKLVAATAVAAVLGLAVGSGVTYLAMDGHGETRASHRTARPAPYGQDAPWGDLPDLGGPGGNGGSGDGKGGGNGNGNGNGNGTGKGKGNGKAGTAADLVNRITLPVPAGWEGGTTKEGFAALSVGAYTCDGGGSCSLGGANTGVIDGGGTDVRAAAKADIEKAAKDSYNDLNSHEELKSEAIKVDGRDGYLVRWKVDAAKGNDGYVQTVVFPSADGKALVSVHLGFDIADKAPDVAVMDTIVKGIADYTGKVPPFPGGGGGSGPDGSGNT
ncbi:DUF2510 domain-containing protein [Kitasatospora sp. NPDC056181]|uniref:DUF2510 domain-containing protein n=1 Tax=Kitasatospora sp. NPDC056181 TaxID=3345737 RepID=UPI0035E35B7F